MLESLMMFGQELIGIFSITNIGLLIGATFLGIVIGAMPGLSATMGVALLTGLTYTMEMDVAVLVLMGLYVGAIYAGSISAVLIGIPGTGSAAATVLDGHPMAMQGRAKLALSAATLASFIGTILGLLCLAAVTGQLMKIALEFTAPEYLLMAIFGVLICGSLASQGHAIKGWIGGAFGLILACVGMESMYAYPRFCYGNVSLYSGITMVPAMIGLFGIPCVLNALAGKQQVGASEEAARLSKKSDHEKIWPILLRNKVNIVRSGLIGTVVGAIPGVGEDVAAWLSYDFAKKFSKKPETFGKGNIEGVLAAECANNAAIGGAMIPLLTLAVPGSAGTAVLLGAFRLHGVNPGPMLSFNNPTFIYYVVAVLVLCAVCMRVCALPACQVAPLILKTPVHILMPIVCVLCCIGSYALNVNIFDVKIMLFFGIIGYLFDRIHIPAAPIVLGLILGPMADEYGRRMLKASGGTLMPLISRPICLVLLLFILLTILYQLGAFKKLGVMLSKSKNK